MNLKPIAFLLVVISVALGGSLYYRHTQAVKKGVEDKAIITSLSEQVVNKEIALREQTLVNVSLDKDLQTRTEEIGKLSQELLSVSNILVKTEADAKTTQAALTAEIAKKEARITDLEGQRDDLTKKMTDLNGSIALLEVKIDSTQKKLAASEGDREFLLKELKRLQAEKAALEQQFNDLAILRDQVKKLRDELSISRRLDWIKRGLYGDTKGGERMMKSLSPPPSIAKPTFDLNVELKSGGGATIAPKTNTPSVTK